MSVRAISLLFGCHGVALRPFASSLVVCGAVGFVLRGNVRDEGIVRVRIGEERQDGEKNFSNRQRGRPLRLENVEADRAGGVDVAMIHACQELNVRRIEGVLGREPDGQLEVPSRVRRVFRPDNLRLPNSNIAGIRCFRADIARRISDDARQLSLDATDASARHGWMKGTKG